MRPALTLRMRRFALFCVAGGLAFLVDAGVLHLLATVWARDPYAARVVSFLCAVTVTWLFNRSLTFADRAGRVRHWLREWAGYVVSQLGGFSVNYAVYALLVWSLPLFRQWPVLGVAAGSAAGLVVNFILASRFVFRK